MNNLTEKWKKGELLEGFYYVKCDWSDEVEIRYVHNGVDDWKDIIEQVPSYEEWKAKLEENAQLKELLKQAETQIIAYKNNDTLPERAFYEKEVEELLGKIDEALR